MNYLLDLDTVSILSAKDSPFHQVAKNNIKSISDHDHIFLSVLSLYELEYSLSNAEDSKKKEEISNLIVWCKQAFDFLLLSDMGAGFYGALKADLKKKTGMSRKAIKKHNIDIMLAATALEYGCILVARDGIYKNHLAPLNQSLVVEDWTTA